MNEAEADKAFKLDPIEARRVPVPAGYKRVYHGHIPHQGAKETARRQRQQRKAAFHKARSDLNGLLNGFAGRENSPEVREEITRLVGAYAEAQTEFREIAQMMADWILAKLADEAPGEPK